MDETFWKSRRDELDKSQFDIAVLVGKTPSAIAAWDNGKATPKLKDTPILAKAYQVSEKRIVDEIVASSKQPAGR